MRPAQVHSADAKKLICAAVVLLSTKCSALPQGRPLIALVLPWYLSWWKKVSLDHILEDPRRVGDLGNRLWRWWLVCLFRLVLELCWLRRVPTERRSCLFQLLLELCWLRRVPTERRSCLFRLLL